MVEEKEELKVPKLTEEQQEILQEEMHKEVERLSKKYSLSEPDIAENIEVEEVSEEEARMIFEDRDDFFAFTEIKEGLGLSASQIGIGKKYFCARDMMDEKNTFKMYFNPKYFPSGKTHVSFKEGCLTYPGKEVVMKRWKNIKFHYDAFDENGEWKHYIKSVGGLNSIVIQHETDHCGNLGNKPKTIMTRKKGSKKT